MRGEIAVGSYSPLPAYTQRNKISTSPVPLRRGQGGIVQRAEAGGERPISVDTETLAVKPANRSNPFGSGEVKKERHKGLYKESSVDREEMEEDKNVVRTGNEVEGASHQDAAGTSHEVGGVLQVPIRRRENSKLRDLLKAIESYDRCVCVCVCVCLYMYIVYVCIHIHLWHFVLLQLLILVSL